MYDFLLVGAGLYNAVFAHEAVKKIMQQFTDFNHFINSPVARYKDELYNMLLNINAFSKMWNITRPQEAGQIIERQSKVCIPLPEIWKSMQLVLLKKAYMKN